RRQSRPPLPDLHRTDDVTRGCRPVTPWPPCGRVSIGGVRARHRCPGSACDCYLAVGSKKARSPFREHRAAQDRAPRVDRWPVIHSSSCVAESHWRKWWLPSGTLHQVLIVDPFRRINSHALFSRRILRRNLSSVPTSIPDTLKLRIPSVDALHVDV
ncbi:hypothetical protein BHE74_00033369, partial [Ensete ventricosum]